jgi:cobalt-zinc-cadmium efflux system outer membrane protein
MRKIFILLLLFIKPLAALHFAEVRARVQLSSPSLYQGDRDIFQNWIDWSGSGLMSNPVFSVEVDGIGGSTCDDDRQITYALTQLIELGGKRCKRQNLALHKVQRAELLNDILLKRQLNKVRKNFVKTAFYQEQVELHERMLALKQELYANVKEKIAHGKIAALQEIKAKKCVNLAELELKNLTNALAQAKRELAILWGETDCENVDFPYYDVYGEPPCLNVEQCPELKLAFWETSRARSEYDLAQSLKIPDISVTGGYSQALNNRGNSLMFEVDIPIPIFNHGQTEVRRACLEVQKMDKLYADIVVRLEIERKKRQEAFETLKLKAEGWQEVAVMARKLRDSIEESYTCGKASREDVLQTLLESYEAEEELLNALLELHEAHADLEYFTCGES